MMVGNHSTLLIGDSIIAGLSRYSSIWKRYFKPLYAINCGIAGAEWKIFYGDVKIYHHALISKMLSSCVVQTTSNTIL